MQPTGDFYSVFTLALGNACEGLEGFVCFLSSSAVELVGGTSLLHRDGRYSY